MKKNGMTFLGLFSLHMMLGGVTHDLMAASSSSNRLKDGHLSLQLGGYWRTKASDQFIYINDLIGDRFTVANTTNSNGLVGISYLIDGQEKERFKMNYGLNWFYLPKTGVTGTVIQEDLFGNLSYHYDIKQYPLYAVAKSIIDTPSPNRKLTLDVGIGPNFIVTSHLQERSIPNNNETNTIPDNIFSGKTTTAFSAMLGAGIQLNHFFGNAPLECGYRFFYLGQGKMNRINDQVINTLQTGTLYANAVMCSITV